MEENKLEGRVKWFSRNKGYGFIEGEDGKEYFVHHSAVKEGFIREDDKVSFETEQTDKGFQAKNVSLVQKGSEIKQEKPEEEQEEQEEVKEEKQE